MTSRSIALLLAFAGFGWTAPPGFETHYVDVAAGYHTVAVAANPVDGSIFVVANNRVIKTDANGNMVAVFDFTFGGPTAAVVDPLGNLLLVGTTADLANFPATAQLVPKLFTPAAFVLRMDSNLTRILSAVLLGGSTSIHPNFPLGTIARAVAADQAGSVYITGTTDAPDFPTSAGAYLATAPPDGGEGVPDYSFVTKLSPDLASILFSTYYGSGGSGTIFSAYTTANSIAVDSRGAPIIGGFTNVNSAAPEGSGGSFPPQPYPFIARLSPGGTALEAYNNFGNFPRIGGAQGGTSFGIAALALDGSGNVWAVGDAGYQSTTLGSTLSSSSGGGYVAKLDTSFNLLFGGFIGTSAVRGLQLDPRGNVWIDATALPGDLPGGSPIQSAQTATPYVAELSSEGSTLLNLLLTPIGGLGMAKGAGGSLVVLGSPDSFLLSSSTATRGPFIVTSSANSVSSGAVAPGELVSLYGNAIGPNTAFGGVVVDDVFSNQLGGYQVLFNDIPAPLFYVGPNQINTVVPEEAAVLTTTGVVPPTVTLKVVGPNGTVDLPSVFIVPSSPAIFGTIENGLYAPGFFAAVLNEDGTVNSASNPAIEGSIVTTWATGLGYENAVDGSIVEQPVGIGPVVVISSGASLDVLYASDAPGEVLGLTQVNFRAPLVGSFAIQTSSGTSSYVSIWVKSQ